MTDNKYNKMIQFSDISYQLSQDEMKQKLFGNYCTLLNSLDDTVQLQQCFINYRLEAEDNDEEILAYNCDNEEFKDLREEYFSFLKKQKEKGNNGIVRNKYLVLSITDGNLSSAKRRLLALEKDIVEQFKIMGSKTNSLDGIERLSVVNYLLNSKGQHYIDLEELEKDDLKNISSKDLLAPKEINFENKEYLAIDRKKVATYYLKIEATELSDRVLAEYLNLDLELLVSSHIRVVEQQKAIKMVRGKKSDLNSIKIEEQKKAIRSGYDMDILPEDLDSNVEESNNILKDLQRENEKYFYMTFTITVFAKNEKMLDDAAFELQSVARKQSCSLIPLKLQQEKALISALPFGNNINEKELERGLTTSSVAIFIPFTTQELYQVALEPVYYGLNALSSNMIQVSRKALKNPNGLFLGTPGSGKSFSAKREIIDTFLRTIDDILICDPEGEYTPFVVRLGGAEIKISPNSVNFLNPLDLSLEYGEGENPIAFKSDFVINLMELVAGGKSGLTAKQKTIVDKCTSVIYRQFLDTPIPANLPILEDLYNEFRAINNDDSQELADALELYVHGSLNIFNNRTNIKTDNRLISFNIQELGSNLKELGMLILQDHVWNKVTHNRQKDRKTWYYMDEFHKLLADEQTSLYSVEFWKRFRKWGGIPTGITQNVKDLLGSPAIETIIDNSDFIYLLNQASSDRKILQATLEISDYQATYITNSKEGEGLLYYDGEILPFIDKFPKNNSLYPVMTTKPEEIKKMRKEQVNA